MQNHHIRDLPVPEPRPGWVRIKVMASGLNPSGLHTRLGYAQSVALPRVLGIEAVDVVDTDPDGDLEHNRGGSGQTRPSWSAT